MLLYRLILLSWLVVVHYEVHAHSHKSKRTKKQSIATNPLRQQQQSLVNAAAQTLQRQAVLHNAAQLAAQLATQQRASVNAHHQQRISQRLMSPRQQQQLLAQQRMLGGSAGGRHMHHPARPTNVKAHGKDLLSQVVASTMPNHHRMQHGGGGREGGLLSSDHPKKYVDYFDNGANWDHFMSRPESSNSEMNIDDANYHVHLKYGGHDELDEDDKMMGTGGEGGAEGHNGETYPGEAISSENSLSKFMSPPVYDEQGETNQQKEREMFEAERRFAPDTPEAAETEKLNTDELVDRLNSLMTPLSSPFDSDGAKKNNLNRILGVRNGGGAMHNGDMRNDMRGGDVKHMRNMAAPKHRVTSYDDQQQNEREQQRQQQQQQQPLMRGGENEAAVARDKPMRYASREQESPDERHYHNTREQSSSNSNTMQGDRRVRVMERMSERAQMKEGGAIETAGATEPYNMAESERDNQYFHGNSKSLHSPSRMEAEEENEDGGTSREENIYHERMTAMLHHPRVGGVHGNPRYEEMYRERLLSNRGNSPKHLYYREEHEAGQHEEEGNERENLRDSSDNMADVKGDSRSFVSAKGRPERLYGSPEYHGRRIN